MIIIEKIGELVCNALLKDLEDIHNNKKLKNEVLEFIDSTYKTKFEALNDEIDFIGICEYINDQFFKDFSGYLLDSEFKTRGKYYETVIAKCLYHGKTRDRASVESFIESLRDIINNFNSRNMCKENILLANSTANDIISTLTNNMENISKNIKEEINKKSDKENSTQIKDIKNTSYWINDKSGKKLNPDEIYQNGNIKAQFGGDRVCAEYMLSDGNATYCEMDFNSRAITNIKSAYPIEEYKWEIPRNLILKEDRYSCIIDGQDCIAEVTHLKFGRKIQKVFHKESIIDVSISTKFFINDSNKTIYILDYLNEANKI